MGSDQPKQPFRSGDKEVLLRKIHRALVEARSASYRGDEEEVRKIIKKIMAEAAPAAYEASKEGSFNWVVEALKPIDDLLLPDDE
jgi:hypothetical protein